MLVHHGQLVARGAHVQAAHGRRQLEQRDGKLVVDKDLQNLHTQTHRHTPRGPSVQLQLKIKTRHTNTDLCIRSD